jgi:hypothetical protein
MKTTTYIYNEKYEVEYNEERDEWEACGLHISAPSLKALKKKIMELDKSARRVGKIPLLYLGGYRGVEEVKATLLSEDRKEVFVIDSDGDRRKRTLNNMIADTEENRATIKEAAALQCEADRLRRQSSELKDSIVRVSVEDLLENKS